MLLVSAATALAKIGQHSGFDKVVALLDVDFAPTRALAVHALSLLTGPTMLDALGRGISDEHAEVRMEAIDPLFLLGTTDSVNLLVDHLDDSDDEVADRSRVRAADCLGIDANGDASTIEATWRKRRPDFADGVCHRLGRPIEVTAVADLLAAETPRPEMADELRTITGLDIDELVEAGQIDEARAQVNQLDLPTGALCKWGHQVPLPG